MAERARDYAGQAKAPNTVRAYEADWRSFSAWCSAKSLTAMPAAPATVLLYLTDHAGVLKVSTLQRRLSAIRQAHEYAGHELVTTARAFRDTWTGIRKAHGAPPTQKAAAVIADIRRAVEHLPDTRIGARDRALLLVGFAGALRRSELAALEVTQRDGAGWIEQTTGGLVLHLARTKADQVAAGEEIGVPYGSHPETCPVRAYKAWIDETGITTGAAFRAIDKAGRVGSSALSDKSVANVIKAAIGGAALASGLSAEKASEMAARYAGHSLRAGLATTAAEANVPGHLIQRQMRHKRFDTTTRYIRKGQIFKQNAAAMVGL